jgi:hypothetical protein
LAASLSRLAVALALAFSTGCDGAPPVEGMVAGDGGVGTSTSGCSQMHRSVSRWQGVEDPACGPDLAGLIELTPVGNHQLLMRRRFSSPYDLWPVSPDGTIGRASTPVPVLEEGRFSAFTLLPGTPPRVLVSDPRLSGWSLYLAGPGGLGSPQVGVWPQGPVFPSQDGSPWGRQFLGLAEGLLLDRDLGDGSARLWRFVPDAAGHVQVELVPGLVGPPREAFRRGHRLVPLGPGRLLEWMPRVCGARDGGAPDDACTGADFNIWTYGLEPAGEVKDPFVAPSGPPQPWPDIGAGDDLVADESHLFLWTRKTGRIRSYALDPAAPDPLGETVPVLDDFTDRALMSQDWDPPTQAPAIKHLVLILQDGRSFDSYFGHYCQGPANPDSTPDACVDQGPACCERMPDSVPGAPTCAALDPAADSHAPAATPDCLRSKINGGLMDGFATASPDGACGDPRDFSCAGAGAAAGALGTYHGLAARGALADRFFQSYAYADGDDAALAPPVAVENLLYLITGRFAAPGLLRSTPLLTQELARLGVSWAAYAGTSTLRQMIIFGVPRFYDPDWYPFRSLEGGELARDIATGQLPSVAVVVPDATDPLRSEAPGHPFDRAIGFVDDLVTSITSSPTYGNNTLVLLTYMTAGGYYDHVAPPPAPDLAVDGSSADSTKAGPVHYGPRVPLLAMPPFARSGSVSHVPLEMSSILVFAEWNWMHGLTLANTGSNADHRRYRDNTAYNLGSLIDPARAEVPAYRK